VLEFLKKKLNLDNCLTIGDLLPGGGRSGILSNTKPIVGFSVLLGGLDVRHRSLFPLSFGFFGKKTGNIETPNWELSSLNCGFRERSCLTSMRKMPYFGVSFLSKGEVSVVDISPLPDLFRAIMSKCFVFSDKKNKYKCYIKLLGLPPDKITINRSRSAAAIIEYRQPVVCF